MGRVRQNPIRRTVRSVHMCVQCALHCAQLLCTILHRTDLIIFPPSYPPDNHRCSDDVYFREGGTFSHLYAHHAAAHLAQVAVAVPGGGSFERLPVRGVQLIPLVTHCLHVVLQQPTALARRVTVYPEKVDEKLQFLQSKNVP